MFPSPKNQEIFEDFHHYWCTPLFFFTHTQQLQQIFELTKFLAIMMMTYGPLAIFCDL